MHVRSLSIQDFYIMALFIHTHMGNIAVALEFLFNNSLTHHISIAITNA